MGLKKYSWPKKAGFVTNAAMALASWGGVGFIPGMPGTYGSLAAVLMAPFVFMPLGWFGRTIVLLVLFAVGAAAATRAEEVQGQKDPGYVVVDEVVGQWLALACFSSLDWPGLLAGFVLFRIFDIFKPWPVNASEMWLPKGWGIMIDDVLAGLYAMIGLLAFRFLGMI